MEIFWWIYMRVRVLKMLVTEIFFLKFFWVAWRHKFDGNFFWSFLIFKTWFLKLLPIAHCFEIFEDFRVNSYASGSFGKNSVTHIKMIFLGNFFHWLESKSWFDSYFFWCFLNFKTWFLKLLSIVLLLRNLMFLKDLF